METLDDYRKQIDALDEEIVALLAKRFEIVKAVGALKAREGLDVVQTIRAEAVKRRVANLAQARGLDGNLLRTIYTAMIDHAHILENAIKDKGRT